MTKKISRKELIFLGLDGLVLLFLIILLGLGKYQACLISAIGCFFASLIPLTFRWMGQLKMDSKAVVLLLNGLRFVILVLACLLPGVVWNYVGDFRAVVNVFYIFTGAIDAFLVYIIVVVNTLIEDRKAEKKDKKSK
ncbi:MAG: hypothetical protein LKM30_02395 [Bacilli bacterium]|jgi:hypothetical protein|nr:hypothetical protein [Bacilli bacterium]